MNSQKEQEFMWAGDLIGLKMNVVSTEDDEGDERLEYVKGTQEQILARIEHWKALGYGWFNIYQLAGDDYITVYDHEGFRTRENMQRQVEEIMRRHVEF